MPISQYFPVERWETIIFMAVGVISLTQAFKVSLKLLMGGPCPRVLHAFSLSASLAVTYAFWVPSKGDFLPSAIALITVAGIVWLGAIYGARFLLAYLSEKYPAFRDTLQGEKVKPPLMKRKEKRK